MHRTKGGKAKEIPTCVFHSSLTFEKERRKDKEFKVQDNHDGGLLCQKCRRYTCNVCMKKLVSLLNKELQHIYKPLLRETLFKDMIKYLNKYDKGKEKTGCFTGCGPCCTIIKVQTVENKAINFDYNHSSMYNTTVDAINPSKSLGVSNINQGNQKGKGFKKSRRRFRAKFTDSIKKSYSIPSIDGALHVPSHHVLLHLPIGVFSTHAMGDQRIYNENGLFHACVNAQVAKEISRNDFMLSKKETSIIRSYETVFEITNPDGVKIKRKTWWTEVKIDRSVVPEKHCHPKKEDILKSSFIDMPPGYDSYAVLGEPYNPTAPYHLLQFTFLDGKSDKTSSLSYSDELYYNLLKRAGKKGLEASRSGGSQGQCDFNDLMKKHLKQPGTFPRHANGMLIIVLNTKKQCGYFGIYCSPYDAEVTMKMWFYNTPQIGGHQKLQDDQLNQFPILTEFPLCRVETAQLLQHRNETLNFRVACPGAIDNFIGEFENATALMVSESFKNSIGYYLAKNCRLTLLAHPVGYHRDTFSNNSGDTIENKVLFICRDQSNTTSTIPLGRGGAGAGMYVYALLDWS